MICFEGLGTTSSTKPPGLLPRGPAARTVTPVGSVSVPIAKSVPLRRPPWVWRSGAPGSFRSWRPNSCLVPAVVVTPLPAVVVALVGPVSVGAAVSGRAIVPAARQGPECRFARHLAAESVIAIGQARAVVAEDLPEAAGGIVLVGGYITGRLLFDQAPGIVVGEGRAAGLKQATGRVVVVGCCSQIAGLAHRVPGRVILVGHPGPNRQGVVGGDGLGLVGRRLVLAIAGALASTLAVSVVRTGSLTVTTATTLACTIDPVLAATLRRDKPRSSLGLPPNLDGVGLSRDLCFLPGTHRREKGPFHPVKAVVLLLEEKAVLVKVDLPLVLAVSEDDRDRLRGRRRVG